MKKSMIMFASAIVAMMAASCSGKASKCDDAQCAAEESATSTEVVYTGLLPAADCDGIQYLLKLDYSDSKDSIKGDYDLVQTYLVTDSAANSVEFKSEGDFVGFAKDGKQYLKLTEESQSAEETYFLVESDSTIVLVNAELEAPNAPGLNYTLTVVK
ncbi:MAG: copper resistance protein NlpE [Bacteroides sp.]|nr:copper resistance protein NlpE [Bacteroides sp.]